ncbi:unnamed protein product [Cylindrotheca closterium]|uniref:Uncharacterized protein n=1 Tax=Cylindrotheca closterium TaxID=2856 RepID=A0AAD2CHD9_9STRA|nr:unnamed protein product [Cylindrotheca closterium]
MDGSVDAKDVRAFLLSRYGIELTKDQVRTVIFRGLAGGEGEDDAIDILEIVAILMIPMLVKVSDELLGSRPGGARMSSIDEAKKRLLPPATIIEDVLRDILRDTTGGDYDVEHPPPLTPALMRQIFLEYDELELVRDDDLIQQMIDMVSESSKSDKLKDGDEASSSPVLDSKTFAGALTKDTNLYNPETETRYSEVLDDVFPDGFEEDVTNIKNTEESANGPPSLVGETFRTVTTFSHMDYTADNFVHVIHVVLVWLVVVFSYFWYMNGVGTPEFLVDSSDNFGRRVGFAVFRWTLTMLKLVIVGSGVSFLLALGNGVFQKSIVEPIVGLASVAVLVFLPYYFPEKNFVFNTALEEPSHEHYTYSELLNMMIVFGVLLIIIQLKNLMTIFFGKGDYLKKNPAFVFMENVLGSNINRAYRSKQAAVYKINEMARSAYDLHQLDEKAAGITKLKREVSIQESGSQTPISNSKVGNEGNRQQTGPGGRSSREIALQKYNDLVDESEEVGGIIWAWKGYISGNLGVTEGVWLPSRLIAANAILFVTIVVVLYICTIIFTGFIWELEDLYNTVALKEVIYNEQCFTEFDYNDCYFPFEEASFYSGVAVCRDVSLSGPGCMDLFEEVTPESTFGSAIGNICDSFNAAFAPFELQVGDLLGGASCPYVLDAAKQSVIEILAEFNYSPNDAEMLYNACYRINYMEDEDISKFNEWFDDDTWYPDITDETLTGCDIVSSIVSNETFVNSFTGREEAAYVSFQICMAIYKSLTPRPFCEQPLYDHIESIITYERNRTDTEFCYSYLSYCVADPYNPSRGTCVIGEADQKYYRFEGSTCDEYPTPWLLTLTAAMGIIGGLIAALATTLVYIPSSIHTILKFRSGVIASLKDPKFIDYRKNLHNQTYLIGSMFWGLIISTAIVTFLTAGITFLLVWPTTRPIVVEIATQAIGIIITVLVKVVVCFVAMRSAYSGFYRSKPMFANVFNVALECWALALTLALVAGRLVKFLVITSFYVGRIDRPVLADGLFLQVDMLPLVFRQNLLSTESHRRPYIEMLGQMYLMKLRHRENFGSKAGSIWRLLFVSALMPWLKKKRIQDNNIKLETLRSFVENQGSSKRIQDASVEVQYTMPAHKENADEATEPA